MVVALVPSAACRPPHTAVDLDLGSGPLPEENSVARFDVERNEFAIVIAAPRADGDHFAFLRLLLGGLGDGDAVVFSSPFEARDHDAIVQRTKCHVVSPLSGSPAPAANGQAKAPLGTRLAEVVHVIALKEGKFHREEATGIVRGADGRASSVK
jgi:hypothetical protein